MTRMLLLALILANLLAFTGWYGLLESWLPGGPEPQRLAAQVAPERLTVMPTTGPRPSGATGGASGTAAPSAAQDPAPAEAAQAPAQGPAAGASAPTTPSAGSESAGSAAGGDGSKAADTPKTATAALADLACVEIGPLDDARAERAREWLRSLPAGLKAGVDNRPETVSYMVYLPPSSQAAEAQRRIDQLRKAGVADLFLIGEGPLRLAISLGIFRSQDGARAHVQALAAKGVTGTRISPIPGRNERAWVRLDRLAGAADATWDAAKAQLQAISGALPAPCTAPGA